MFADPQSITINSVAQSLAKTAVDGSSSVYTKDDGSYQLTISHENGKRNRRMTKLRNNKFTPDPYVPAQNQKVYAQIHTVVDAPLAGFTNAELKQFIQGYAAWLSVSANIDKLLGGES